MKPEEAIRHYIALKEDCLSRRSFTARERIDELAKEVISMIEKQVPKKPILIQHPQPYKRDFKCPVCGGDVNRQWEYELYDDSMIGEDQYEHCPYCGQKIDWRKENEKSY